MSKLSKFIGQSKEIEIRGEKIKLFPLTVKEMGILDSMHEIGKKENQTQTEKEELAKLGRDLLKAAFKEENLTDVEIEGMDIDMYSDLFAAVMEYTYEQKDGKGLTRIRELKAKAEKQAKSG
jgi:hypothetical protein